MSDHTPPADQKIVDASHKYLAAADRLNTLHATEAPDKVTDQMVKEMEAAQKQALKRPATTMEGVIAKAEMALRIRPEADQLTISTLEDLRAVYKASTAVLTTPVRSEERQQEPAQIPQASARVTEDRAVTAFQQRTMEAGAEELAQHRRTRVRSDKPQPKP